MEKEIAFGFGNTVDYEVKWSSKVINSLIEKWNIYKKDIKNVDIKNERDLVITILYHMMKEKGGNKDVIENQLIFDFASHFSKKVTLGGTGVRAAMALDNLGIPSILHLTTTNEHVRALLPKSCSYYPSAKEDTLYPHLIVQYDINSIVKANDIEIHPSRANRIIYSYDYISKIMPFSDEFYTKGIESVKVIQEGCFESMVDQALVKDRMDYLIPILKKAKERGTIIYGEMGCHHSDITREVFIKRFVPIEDILSMNEDELSDLAQREVNLLDPLDVKNALLSLRKKLAVPIIVVHSKYWAIAFGKNAELLKECLESGTALATTRFRFGDVYGIKELEDTKNLPKDKKGKRFCEEICKEFPTDFVCTCSLETREEDVTTIGLGDTFVAGFVKVLSKIDKEKLLK